jgi:hypothetical protein
MAENPKNKAFDNSELLRKAALDREEYYNQIEAEKKEERLKLEADAIWREEKRRAILDLEDQIGAIESSNKFLNNSISYLYNQGDENNFKEIESIKERIESNQRKITHLRIEIDDVLAKKNKD